MSKYTTELRRLIESGYDLGLKTYPIFEESYRTILNGKILSHYKFREIGFETAGLFKSPPTRGAWIEIKLLPSRKFSHVSSPPHGGRGLKYPYKGLKCQARLSPPTRGAWIEIEKS